MNEESFTSSGVTTAEGYPGAPHQSPLQAKAGETAHSFQNEAERLKGAARDKTTAAVDQVKAGFQSATEQAQQAGKSFFQQQQESLAGRCSQYAQAARAASQCLNSGETNMLAAPAAMAADRLEQLAGYIKREPGELMSDIEGFARRRPEVVFGGLFVLGLAASRFLKASRRDLEERQRARGFVPSPVSSEPYTSDYDHGSEIPGSTYSGGMQTGSSFPSSSGVGTQPGITPSPGTSSASSIPPWSTNVVPESQSGNSMTDSGDCGCSTTPAGSTTSTPLP